MGRIGFSLSSLSAEYSAQFMEIVKGALMEDPKERISLGDGLGKI